MLSLNKLLINTLIKSNQFSYYIHLKDHNKKINPEKNKLSLSYMNPKIVKDNAPQEKSYQFNLRKKTQRELQRKMFQQYKEKVLSGQIDQDQLVELDPLWGEDPKPRHYFQNLSKSQLMAVSNPQNQQFMNTLTQLHQGYFKTVLTQAPSLEQIRLMNPYQCVQASLYARLNEINSIQYWHQIQKSLGNRLYDLDHDQLIKLNFCIKGPQTHCTPRLHHIIKDLLEQDLSLLLTNQLISLFYSLMHSKSQGALFQEKIISVLSPHLASFTTQEKINFLFTYTLGRRPQTYKSREQKVLFQQQRKGHQIIFNLHFSEQLSKQLNVESAVKLIYSLVKLRACNTKFISDQIVLFLQSNIEQLSKSAQNCYKILFYSQQLQDGAGIYPLSLYNFVIPFLTTQQTFSTLTKIQQLRTIFSIWNYNLLTDQIFQLYKTIPIQPNTTELFYFTQLEMAKSSQREWEVLKNLAGIESVPLPYYQAYKRFFNYMKTTVDWDLTPIEQKLKNTQYFFDSERGKSKFQKIQVYRDLMKYYKFAQQISPFEHTIPIQNLQIVQFCNATCQVSVDIISQSGFIPGTSSLKSTYRAKTSSLSSVGWKHIYLRQSQISILPINQQIQQILYAYQPYVQEQLEVLRQRDQNRNEVIQALRDQQYWNMIGQEAEGYRNDPETYAKMVADKMAEEIQLSLDIAKSNQ